MDKQHTVMLIYGGRGYEREVSLVGMKNILPLIIKNGYRVLPVQITDDGRWLLNESEATLTYGGLATRDGFIKIDCAFPLLHGNFGEDGRVQGALDCASIPYVGCDAPCGAICRDKFIVKTVAKELDIPVLPCLLAKKDEDIDRTIFKCESGLGYPMFVKPASLGSSVGASCAYDRGELESALVGAFQLCDRVIIESCLCRKRELECGFLRVNGKELFTKCGEILINGFYSYDKKYISPEVKISVEADVPDEINKQIAEYSKRLVRALSIRDISRIDFFLSDGQIFFNEINTMPGMTKTSLYPRMIELAGIKATKMIRLLIDGAISRT